MVIFRKKRIAFILIVLMTSIISFNSNKNKYNTIETISLPVSNKTIVLDAGHGYPDERSRKYKWSYRSQHKLKNNPKDSITS